MPACSRPPAAAGAGPLWIVWPFLALLCIGVTVILAGMGSHVRNTFSHGNDTLASADGTASGAGAGAGAGNGNAGGNGNGNAGGNGNGNAGGNGNGNPGGNGRGNGR